MADPPIDPGPAPISRIPGYDDARDDALSDFLATGVRPWGGEPVALPAGITVLVWTLGLADAVFGGWLATARAGLLRPSGWWFDVATLGAPDVVLTMAAANAVVVAALAVPTRGLTRASAVPLGLAVAGCIAGSIALLGIAVLLLITAVVVGALVGVLAFAATRL